MLQSLTRPGISMAAYLFFSLGCATALSGCMGLMPTTPDGQEPEFNQPQRALPTTVPPVPLSPLPPDAGEYQGAAPVGAAARLGRGSVRDVRLSPDGHWAAILTDSGLYIYATEPELMLDFAVASPPGFLPSSVYWSAQGNGVIVIEWTAVADRTSISNAMTGISLARIEMWDITTGARHMSLPAHRYQARLAAFNPQSRRTATPAQPGSVQVVDSRNNDLVYRSDIFPADTRIEQIRLAWSADGERLAAAYPGWAVILDGSTGGLLTRLDEYAGHAHTFLWSDDRSTLGVLRRNGEFGLWDTASGSEVFRAVAHQPTISWAPPSLYSFPQLPPAGDGPVALSPDGRRFAAASEDRGRLYLVSTASGTIEHTLMGSYAHLAWLPDSRRLAAVTASGSLRLIDTKLALIRDQTEGHRPVTDEASQIAWSADGQILAVAGGGLVTIWDVTGWEPVAYIDVCADFPRWHCNVSSLQIAASPSENLLAVSLPDMFNVGLYDMRNGTLVTYTDMPPVWSWGGLVSLGWSPDGDYLGAGYHSFVRVWDGGLKETVVWYRTHGQLTWAPDTESIVTISESDDRYMVWDSGERNLVVDFSSTLPLLGVGWIGSDLSPLGVDGYTLVLLDEQGAEHLHLSGQSAQVSALEWPPAHPLFVAGAADGVVMVWDAATGSRLFRLDGHSDAVTDMAWSPDGSTLATASADGTVLLWAIGAYSGSNP